jgi:hypothetical protein
MDKLDAGQRKELQPILIVDGPDFESRPPKRNHLSALASNLAHDALEFQCGGLRIQWGIGNLDPEGIGNSLLMRIANTYGISETVGKVALYIIQNNLIDEVALDSLVAIESSDSSFISTIFQASNSNLRKERLGAVLDVIPALANSQSRSL